MGCGASKEGAAHAPVTPSSVAANVAKKAPSADDDRSQPDLDDDFDDDDDQSGAGRANRAVELITRTCEGVVPDDPPPGGGSNDDPPPPPPEEDHQATNNAGLEEALAVNEDDHGEPTVQHGLESRESSEYEHGGSEKDPREDPEMNGEQQAPVEEPPKETQVQIQAPQLTLQLPKAATAALEAIVAQEEDVQTQKVAAAVAAIREILFGGRDLDDLEDEKLMGMHLRENDDDKGISKEDLSRALEMVHTLNSNFGSNKENENFLNKYYNGSDIDDEDLDEKISKNSFLYEYCQKLRANGYKLSPPSSSLSSPTSADETLTFVQDFLEEIDLTISCGKSVPTRDVCSNTTPRIALKADDILQDQQLMRMGTVSS